jgi:hypothetical protein
MGSYRTVPGFAEATAASSFAALARSAMVAVESNEELAATGKIRRKIET